MKILKRRTPIGIVIFRLLIASFVVGSITYLIHDRKARSQPGEEQLEQVIRKQSMILTDEGVTIASLLGRLKPPDELIADFSYPKPEGDPINTSGGDRKAGAYC